MFPPRRGTFLFIQVGCRAPSLRKHCNFHHNSLFLWHMCRRHAPACTHTWVSMCLKFRLIRMSFCRHDEISGAFTTSPSFVSLAASQYQWSRWTCVLSRPMFLITANEESQWRCPLFAPQNRFDELIMNWHQEKKKVSMEEWALPNDNENPFYVSVNVNVCVCCTAAAVSAVNITSRLLNQVKVPLHFSTIYFKVVHARGMFRNSWQQYSYLKSSYL